MDMGKKGPCWHCGIDTTPLWRNGPEDKPVLCNACGSRYRLCGTLDAYFPKHFHSGRLKNLQNLKAKSNHNVKDKPSSNVPNSGRTCSSLWSTKIPTRKRSRVMYLEMTPIERFQNQLYNLWRFHGQPNEPEEVLLQHNVNNFIPSNEIGLGATLLKPDGTSTQKG